MFLATASIVHAVYIDTTSLSNFSIIVADFNSDTIPPISLITTDTYLQTSPNFDIDFTIIDDNPSYIDFCYSFNLGQWQCQSTNLISPYNFNANQGQGVYCFDTIAHDTYSNTEINVLPPPTTINPLDTSTYCTQLILPSS